MDPPRIKDYPYATNSEMSFVLNVLPRSIQHAMSKWFADYMLKSLTPQNYFPEEFLLGGAYILVPIHCGRAWLTKTGA